MNHVAAASHLIYYTLIAQGVKPIALSEIFKSNGNTYVVSKISRYLGKAQLCMWSLTFVVLFTSFVYVFFTEI